MKKKDTESLFKSVIPPETRHLNWKWFSASLLVFLACFIGFEYPRLFGTPAPSRNTIVEPGWSEACTDLLYQDGTTPVDHPGNGGSNIVGTAGGDWGAFINARLASGHAYCFEPGTYAPTTGIVISVSNVHILGQPGATFKPASGFTGDLLRVDVDASGQILNNTFISTFTIDMINAGAGSNAVHIKYTGATTLLEYSNIRLFGLTIKNVPAGASFQDGAGVYVTAKNNVPTLGQAVKIEYCNFQSDNVAIETAGTSGLIIDSITVTQSPDGGIWIGQKQTPDNAVVFGTDTLLTMTNVVMFNAVNALSWVSGAPQNRGMYVSASAWELSNVIIQGFGEGVRLANTERSESALSNFDILFNSGIGIAVTGGSTNALFPMVLANGGTHGNGGGTGGGSGATGSGIYVVSASLRCSSVWSNKNSGWGIYLDTTGNNAVVRINDCDLGAASSLANTSGALTLVTPQGANANLTISGNPGYDPVGKVTNMFSTTPNWLSPFGSTATPVASTTYTVQGPSIYNFTSTGGTGVVLTIKDGTIAGNCIVCGAATITNLSLVAGDTISFGAFSVAPTVKVFEN